MRRVVENTFSGMNPKLEVRGKRLCGRAICTTASIERRERLFAWGGVVMPVRDITDDLGLQIAEDLVLTPTPPGVSPEPACFVNHSCNPNAGFQGQIVLVAMRPILANEAYWKYDPMWQKCVSDGVVTVMPVADALLTRQLKLQSDPITPIIFSLWR